MIVTKDKNVWVNNPADGIKDIDGAYYGIICSKAIPKDVTVPLDALMYICSIYIPEVYGIFSSAQNYPYVEIPYKQDIDDEGHEPKIGELCKVMFEAGKSYTCRLVYYVKINEQVRILNENYILYGILPSTTIDKPDEKPDNYKKFTKEFIDIAYYITTGHKKSELTYRDFMPGCLGSRKNKEGKSPAKNYFCTALSIPFMSYFTDDWFSLGIPIDASSKYNIYSVFLNIYNKNINDISNNLDKYFNNKDYDWIGTEYSLYEIYQNAKGKVENLEEIMEKVVIATISYCNPKYTKLIFPDVGDLPDDIFIYLDLTTLYEGNYTYVERVWDVFTNENTETQKFYMSFPKTLYDFREQIETEWKSAMSAYESGFHTDDLKINYTMLLCLTICPWLAYPLIGYQESVKLNDELNLSLQLNKQDPRDFRTYSTYLNSDEEFTEVQKKLNTLTKLNDPLQLVSSFRDIAYSVFGDGKLSIQLGLEYKNTWDYYKMDDKFSRLKDALPKFLETII